MTGPCVIPRLKKKLLGPSLAPSPARSRPLSPAKSFLGQSVRHPFPKRMREPWWSASPEPGLTKEQRSGPERCPGPGPHGAPQTPPGKAANRPWERLSPEILLSRDPKPCQNGHNPSEPPRVQTEIVNGQQQAQSLSCVGRTFPKVDPPHPNPSHGAILITDHLNSKENGDSDFCVILKKSQWFSTLKKIPKFKYKF